MTNALSFDLADGTAIVTFDASGKGHTTFQPKSAPAPCECIVKEWIAPQFGETATE